MDWTYDVAALADHSHVLVSVIVGCLAVKQLPRLIAAFRVAVARNDDEAERARKVLEALESSWHWIWQRRG
jgi:hypothetical protein